MTDPDIEIILPDDEKILVCPRCYTHNPEASNFCLNCGFSLRKGLSNRTKWIWLLISVLIFVVGMYYFYHRLASLESQTSISRIPQPRVPAASNKSDIVLGEDAELEQDEVIPPDPQKTKIPVGLVVIKDIAGKIINEVPVAVVGGGWVALPKRLCLGGSEWTLKMGPDTELSIESGIYSDYDKIGLWRVLEDLTIEGPELDAWTAEEPLTWLSLASQDSPEPVEFNNPGEQGYFIEGVLRDDFNEIGILIQQDRIVGWTFGDYITGAFVWNGDEGKYLVPQIRVDDFYRITFANSREEEFTRALAMGADYSGLERLEAYANGFKYETRLADNETPDHLKKEAVIERMRPLIAEALNAGNGRQVADIFDAQILIEAADSELLADVARATAQSYGYEDAIDLLENVIAGFPQLNEQDAAKLTKFFSSLYQNWIVASINQGHLESAWRAFRLGSRKLPDDVDIHLLGVRLALAENDWAEAERLLSMKEYPNSLTDKVQNLQAQISELKAQEGKIVIHFTPGSRHIPATAVLNRSTYQQFIVDTGASMVTIPMSTAEKLGLTVDERNPQRKIFTAGGVTYAPEVNLTSITVEGWEINNVKALVLDLPNQSELGLLGLNYLRRFHMVINTERGTLMLEPR
jgi:clan AA aspartic protease (TIGR02281 family)